MLEQLAKQFLGTDQASSIVSEVASKAGIGREQAESAVEATADGAAEQLSGAGGLASMLGGGGGGGLMGMAGSLLGGGGGGASAAGVPPEVASQIVDFVANKTGLSKEIATTVVNVALPKIVAYAKGMMS